MEGALVVDVASIFILEDKASKEGDILLKSKGALERTIRISFSMLKEEEIRVVASSVGYLATLRGIALVGGIRMRARVSIKVESLL
ncbi:hypothetical protein S83_023330 [Arachis hypogaea]